MLKVKGSDSLVRDPNNKAIINSNTEEHRKYLIAKERAKREKEALESNSKEIQDLRSEISELKSMLLQLLSNQGKI